MVKNVCYYVLILYWHMNYLEIHDRLEILSGYLAHVTCILVGCGNINYSWLRSLHPHIIPIHEINGTTMKILRNTSNLKPLPKGCAREKIL